MAEGKASHFRFHLGRVLSHLAQLASNLILQPAC